MQKPASIALLNEFTANDSGERHRAANFSIDPNRQDRFMLGADEKLVFATDINVIKPNSEPRTWRY